MGLPADASGAYRPNPQATTKLAPRPSSRKGYKEYPTIKKANFVSVSVIRKGKKCHLY
jgi:hypothetical protein